MFNDETSSLLKKQSIPAACYSWNRRVTPSPDDERLMFRSTNKTLKTKKNATKRLSSPLVPCASAAARWLFPPSSSSSSSLRMFNTSRLGGGEEFETAGGTSYTSLKMVLTANS